MKKRRLNKIIIISILLIAIFGAVMFFPIKMKSGKTCLFHRIFGGDEKQIPDHVPYMEQAQLMSRRYLVPFGFAWWFSLGILAITIYHLKNRKIKMKEHL